jgi:hydroxypyruvate isomerase
MYRAGEPSEEVKKYADMLCHIHVAEPPERVFPGKNGGDYLRDFAYMLNSAGL